MKQFIYIFSLAVVIAGCSDNVATAGKESTTTVTDAPANELGTNIIQPGINDVNVDTLGMAEFLAQKAADVAAQRQSNGIQSNDINDINSVNVDTIGFAEFKRMKAETALHATEDSIRRADIIAERKRYNSSQNAKPATTKNVRKQTRSINESNADAQTEVAKQSPAVKEKKGWSNKAKGAVIGAATGAAAGAVINKKNRGVGGVVGGVVGAAAGYGIGRQKDKKDTVRKNDLINDTTNY